MKRIGMSDEQIITIFGYLPDIDMDPTEVERHCRELIAELKASQK